MRIIIDITPQPPDRLASVLTPELFAYTNKITFPWSITPSPSISGPEVGRLFFSSQATARKDWSGALIRDSLIDLSRFGLEKIILENITALLPDPDDPEFFHHVTGLVLFLDQGPRYSELCKGIGRRYVYEYFDVVARNLVGWLLALPENQNPFNLQSWTRLKIPWDHAMIRICMLLAPLVHSEVLGDMDIHLDIAERLRKEIEEMSWLKDPHRETFRQDLKDEHLIDRLLRDGPPQEEWTGVEEFVWWIFRYFTGHVGILEKFGRSPWRNWAVGRDDTEQEKVWFTEINEEDADEVARGLIKGDKMLGRWRELE